ncbi:MAG: PAS domain S-box protein, partial [Anaerolineae bacterium]
GNDALTVLTGIGNLAGSAIQHAQLFEELQAAHKRYRDLFNNSTDAILITSLQGEIIEANYQTTLFTHIPSAQLRGKHIGEIHRLDTEVVGPNLEYIGPNETLTYESDLTTGENPIPVEVKVHPILFEGSQALQWTMRDITTRKELDQLRDDLISMVYHDLRSPLANVLSSLDVLESIQSFDEDPTIKTLFEIAVRSTRRIERLTNSLLDFNRLEAGQPVTNTSPTDPKELIESAVLEVQPIASNKDQKIIVRVQEGLPPAEIDESMIQRVLINLMENAVKYTPPQSHITVGAALAGDKLSFWVEDTGPGIPPEKRATIFDKYTRLHEKGGPKGIGLGLAYCRLAVEGHGGRIWVEEASSGGARFVFTLPVAAIEQEETDQTTAHEA